MLVSVINTVITFILIEERNLVDWVQPKCVEINIFLIKKKIK